ncbi:MAG: DUF4249 family protein, partial [Saprospiraceae bacterium]|nr:DUF4249 family protein [Saprospiraceae bacterium]
MTIKSIKSLLIAALALACASCEKVIDVDLNSAAPRTVIEANLKEGDQQFQVLVYQTKDYF